MIIKGIIDEDFVNYKKCSMYIAFPYCTFKCDKENGCQLCQNMALNKEPNIVIDTEELVKRYLDNPLTHSITMCGLEPLDSFNDVLDFVTLLREKYNCNDDIVIYTGYNKEEITTYINMLKTYNNIIIKYGRFRPNQKAHFDEVLGVELISDNQYAEKIS